MEAKVGPQPVDIAALKVDLDNRTGQQAKRDFLMKCYPGVYQAALKVMIRADQKAEVEKFATYCQECRNDPEEFTTYIYGYLEPWFRSQRAAGCIVKSSKVIDIEDFEDTKFNYEGELD